MRGGGKFCEHKTTSRLIAPRSIETVRVDVLVDKIAAYLRARYIPPPHTTHCALPFVFFKAFRFFHPAERVLSHGHKSSSLSTSVSFCIIESAILFKQAFGPISSSSFLVLK
jgi:hypothetical protein